MSNIVIKVEGQGKKYRIGSSKSGDFRENFGQFVDKLRIWRGGDSKSQINSTTHYWESIFYKFCYL
jgi:hypothetical protein